MRKRYAILFCFVFILTSFLFVPTATATRPVTYDIAIMNGMVMDPASGMDMVANVGIKDSKIAIITTEEIYGIEEIDATGLIVTPGFIDMHTHAGSFEPSYWMALMGVTTVVEADGGPWPWEPRIETRIEGKLVTNFAGYTGHDTLRGVVGVPTIYDAMTPEQIELAKICAEQSMREGAFGVAYGIQYVPGSSYEEVRALAEVVAEYGGHIALHLRWLAMPVPEIEWPGAIGGIKEVIKIAEETGVSVHISHLGSTMGQAMWLTQEGFKLIEDARARGLDITADCYAYTAGSTGIGTAVFDPGWKLYWNADEGDVMICSTCIINGVDYFGHFCDEKIIVDGVEWLLFDYVRKYMPRTMVVFFMIKEECMIEILKKPYVMCGSDGAVAGGRGHPRGAGNFPRFLGHYVRDMGIMPLMEALRKCSLMQAERLGLKNKGRLRPGADADVTIFNYDTIIDKATWLEPCTAPEGIEYVIVNGVTVVREGEWTGVTPCIASRHIPGMLYGAEKGIGELAADVAETLPRNYAMMINSHFCSAGESVISAMTAFQADREWEARTHVRNAIIKLESAEKAIDRLVSTGKISAEYGGLLVGEVEVIKKHLSWLESHLPTAAEIAYITSIH